MRFIVSLGAGTQGLVLILYFSHTFTHGFILLDVSQMIFELII